MPVMCQKAVREPVGPDFVVIEYGIAMDPPALFVLGGFRHATWVASVIADGAP